MIVTWRGGINKEVMSRRREEMLREWGSIQVEYLKNNREKDHYKGVKRLEFYGCRGGMVLEWGDQYKDTWWEVLFALVVDVLFEGCSGVWISYTERKVWLMEIHSNYLPLEFLEKVDWRSGLIGEACHILIGKIERNGEVARVVIQCEQFPIKKY